MQSGEHAEPQKKSLLKPVLEFVITIALIFGLAFLMRTFVIGTYQIPTGSMEETIMVNDLVLTEKISYQFGEPKAGDIVTFTDPDNSERTLIKRVIAVGGQTVDLQNGVVYVDGVALNEPYTLGKPTNPMSPIKPLTQAISYPYTVPADHIWVMGDNRTHSGDSRAFGSVPVSTVSGHGLLVYWPIEHFGMFK